MFDGKLDKKLGVPTLNMECAIAEKLWANADRGLDESTLARDLTDLAFAAAHAGKNPLHEALELAVQRYGEAFHFPWIASRTTGVVPTRASGRSE